MSGCASPRQLNSATKWWLGIWAIISPAVRTRAPIDSVIDGGCCRSTIDSFPRLIAARRTAARRRFGMHQPAPHARIWLAYRSLLFKAVFQKSKQASPTSLWPATHSTGAREREGGGRRADRQMMLLSCKLCLGCLPSSSTPLNGVQQRVALLI